MNITAMYFSGTGTTKKVTAAIADELTEIKISQDETAAGENPGSIKAGIKLWQRAADIDFTPPAARREIYRFTPDDLVVFGIQCRAEARWQFLSCFMATGILMTL